MTSVDSRSAITLVRSVRESNRLSMSVTLPSAPDITLSKVVNMDLIAESRTVVYLFCYQREQDVRYSKLTATKDSNNLIMAQE